MQKINRRHLRLSNAVEAATAMPQHDAMVESILQRYDACPEARAHGLDWYCNARGLCEKMAEKGGVSLATACAVVAALSPQLRWDANINAAWAVMARMLPHGVLKSNVAKALALVHGADIMDVLGGPKVNAFFANLFCPSSDAVTVDVWAARAAGMPEGLSLTPARYRAVAAAYVEAAALREVRPHQVQAVAWCQIRGSHS